VLRIAQALLETGHQVTLASSKELVENWKELQGLYAQGLSVLPIEDGYEKGIHVFFGKLKKKHNARFPNAVWAAAQDIWFEKSLAAIKELHTRQPVNYAVVDWFASGFARALCKLAIDYCVNLPGPASFLWLMRHEGTKDWSVLPLSERREFFVLTKMALSSMVRTHEEISAHRPWLVNSVSKLELDTIKMPELCEFTGPLTRQLGTATLGDEFAEFFESAVADGMPVVCVSLGSIMKPDRIIINAIYDALSGGPWRVIWSLGEWGVSQISQQVDTQQFLISKWIPQMAVLMQPTCKVFLTHGGWGGIMEALGGGVPLLVLPFFGDQPLNAQLVEEKGWGLTLPDQKVFPAPKGFSEPPHYTGSLQADEVRMKTMRLVTESSFSRVAHRLQAFASGGSTGAAQRVEKFARLSEQGKLPCALPKHSNTFRSRRSSAPLWLRC